MSENRCNAPCVINATAQFQVVCCDKKTGHEGEHSFTTVDSTIHRPVIFEWLYTGDSRDCGISPALPLDLRCESWTRIKPLVALRPAYPGPEYRQELVLVDGSTHRSSSGFCCEKTPGHEDLHTRTGVFTPLGIAWKIRW